MSSSAKLTSYEDLSRAQQEVVSVWGQGLAVLAGAGSGKTTTLTIKCEQLLDRQPEARFCAVSFTEKSASDLKLKLETRLAHRQKKLRGEGGVLSGHWVMTIHGLCGAIVREFPAQAGIDGYEPILSESQAKALWERALEKLWREDVPADVREAMDQLLGRMKRSALHGLISRVKSLRNQGALGALQGHRDEPQWADSIALGVVAERAIHYYETMKSRRGALDFDDLERLADRVLSDEQARSILQSRFDFIMVDEFQDTSPLQGRIVWNLARPDQSNLCVIGDPKQSIYRFRDADVSVFEEFCAQLPQQKTLGENYRSRPEIIHFTNQVCEPIFAASHQTYVPLDPRKPPLESDTTGVLLLRLEDPRGLATWLKKEEQERGLSLEKFVVLLRKVRSSKAARWLDALTLQGIPLAIGSGGRFWDDPRVSELVHFLKWWNNPGNRLSAAAFLRAPWVEAALSLHEQELDHWLQDEVPTNLWQRFWSKQSSPLVQALRPYCEGVLGVTPGELLLQLLISDEVEQEIGISVLGLWHRAQELSHEGRSFHEVVEELSRGMEESPRESEIPPPQTEGQLRVLTVHASKGLEFEQVLLLDFDPKAERAPTKPALFWDRKKGVFLPPATPSGVSKKLTSADPELEWKTQELAAELAEVKRVFYVALTRAQERLICVFPGEDPAPKESSARSRKVPTSVALKDDWRGWILEFGRSESPGKWVREEIWKTSGDLGLGSGLVSSSSSLLRITRGSARMTPEVPHYRPRHSVTEWMTLLRCPRQYDWTYIRPRLGDPMTAGSFESEAMDGEGISGVRSSLSAAEIGTRVHRALEIQDFDDLHRLEKEVGERVFRAEPVQEWARNSALMSHPQEQSWKELMFELVVQASPQQERDLLVGTLDRLIQLESLDQWQALRQECEHYGGDASLWGEAPSEFPVFMILDFKVLRRSKKPDALKKTYADQLRLYSWALSRMEPLAMNRIRAALVVLSPDQGVEWVPLSLDSCSPLEEWVQGILNQSHQVVQANGRPRVSESCRQCEFRVSCQRSGSEE